MSSFWERTLKVFDSFTVQIFLPNFISIGVVMGVAFASFFRAYHFQSV